MLKKTLTFNDYSTPPKPTTRDFYFNLESTDMAELQFSRKEGFIDYMKRIILEEDAGALIAAVKELLERSVGKKHADNIRFERTPEITAEFMESKAYPTLFNELLENDGEEILTFILGVIPPEFAKEVTPEAIAAAKAEMMGQAPEQPAWIKENRDPTMEEFKSMTPDEQAAAFAAKQARKPVETVALPE